MSEYLNIPYTLTIAAAGDKSHFVTEFDCELEVTFDSPEDWYIDAVAFTAYRDQPAFSVTAKSDPDLWKLMERAFEHSSMSISDKVLEAAYEARRDRMADYGDYLHDIRMEG